MKILTLIAGINGVGKTSLAGVLASQRDDLGVRINFDEALPNFPNPTAAGTYVARKIKTLLAAGISFTQETTLSGQSIFTTIQRAREKGYRVRMFYVGLNTQEECSLRVHNRVQKGGHAIRDEDIRRRFQTRFQALARALPYCNEAYFYDNENGFVEIGRYRNGRLTLTGEACPGWAAELQKALGEEGYAEPSPVLERNSR
jgi:predicted ABC-type ATPase